MTLISKSERVNDWIERMNERVKEIELTNEMGTACLGECINSPSSPNCCCCLSNS